MFKLRVLSEWTCQGCQQVHTAQPQDETGLQLQITSPAGPNTTIQSFVEAYFSDVVIDAECERCKSRSNRRRVRTINAPPEVLFIQLQRFERDYNISTGRFTTSKITKDVPFGQWLDLSRFAQSQTFRHPGSLRYKLSSVVAHQGTLNNGHYIAFGQGPQGVLKYNDSRVTKSSLSEMLHPSNDFTPYILTYTICESTTANAETTRTVAMEAVPH